MRAERFDSFTNHHYRRRRCRCRFFPIRYVCSECSECAVGGAADLIIIIVCYEM